MAHGVKLDAVVPISIPGAVRDSPEESLFNAPHQQDTAKPPAVLGLARRGTFALPSKNTFGDLFGDTIGDVTETVQRATGAFGDALDGALDGASSSIRPRRVFWRVVGFLAPLLIVVPFVILVFGHNSLQACDRDPETVAELYVFFTALGVMGAFAASVLVVPKVSSQLRLVLLYIFLGGLAVFVYICSLLRRSCRGVENTSLVNYSIVVWIAAQVVLDSAVIKSIKVLERILWTDLRTRRMKRICLGMLCSLVLLLSREPFRLANRDNLPPFSGYGLNDAGVMAWAVGKMAASVLHAAFSFLAIPALYCPLKYARSAEHSIGRRAQEGEETRVMSRWATKSATRQFYVVSFVLSSTFAMMLLNFVGFMVQTFEYLPAWFFLLDGVLVVINIVSGAVCALDLSGVISQSLAGEGKLAKRKERLRMKNRKNVMSAWEEVQGRGGDSRWWAKVTEMSERGFTLQALLEFYKGLGKNYMLHFDSKKHTTNDVVRQAIIPLSKEPPCAYASVMMNHKPTRPQFMVTHNWGNLFRDLVAAIVADALGSSDFGMIADLLDWDFDGVEHMVCISGKLQVTYWVCAFSVSQHDGICGGNPGGSTDTVTGQLFSLCDCGKPKYFNSDAPLGENGQSILCEMNKFDDMMGLLAATDESFAQIIAVDAHFQLFGRAWCVAELAEAHEMGMKQHLKVISGQSLKDYAPKLRSMKVEEMEASRPEDVEDILSKIPDKEAFNAGLQDLIFGGAGLLAGWSHLDGEQQMARVGQCLRWTTMREGRDSCWSGAKKLA